MVLFNLVSLPLALVISIISIYNLKNIILKCIELLIERVFSNPHLSGVCGSVLNVYGLPVRVLDLMPSLSN